MKGMTRVGRIKSWPLETGITLILLVALAASLFMDHRWIHWAVMILFLLLLLLETMGVVRGEKDRSQTREYLFRWSGAAVGMAIALIMLLIYS